MRHVDLFAIVWRSYKNETGVEPKRSRYVPSFLDTLGTDPRNYPSVVPTFGRGLIPLAPTCCLIIGKVPTQYEHK